MPGRGLKDVYLFIADSNKMFYKATRAVDGSWVVSSNAQPYPILNNPSNLKNSTIEFATNSKYFSLVRTISYPLDFIEDGAAILRSLYINGKGFEQIVYLYVLQWTPSTGIYELSYIGKIDFTTKKDSPKTNTFTVSTVDDSAWGVLSQNDTVKYNIDCSATNPKAIPVLFDGITLKDKYTFSPVVANYGPPGAGAYYFTFPISLINQDGDSSGVLVNSQSLQLISTNNIGTFNSFLLNNPPYALYSQYGGTYDFSGLLSVVLATSGNNGQAVNIFYCKTGDQVTSNFPFTGITAPNEILTLQGNIPNQRFDTPTTFSVTLAAGESVAFYMYLYRNSGSLLNVQVLSSLIYTQTTTKAQPTISYALRPLDLLQAIVNKATNGRFTIHSDYFSTNNKVVCLPGNSIRQQPNAYIQASFEDFFKSYDGIIYLALRIINGDLYIEPITTVYAQNTTLFDLGEAIDLEFEVAIDMLANVIKTGSPNQDYRHPSGILETNSLNTFSMPFLMVNKTIDISGVFRKGCFDLEFLRLDYQGGSTQDNLGDTSVYMVDITDNKAVSETPVENFLTINVIASPLEPILKYPLNNAIINYNKPVISGIAPSGRTVNVYVDTVLDGSAVADSNGNWIYSIVTALTSYDPTVHTGEHVIDVTFGTEVDPKSTISIVVDTTFTAPLLLTYPLSGDTIYDNKPLLKGTAQQGISVAISIDGILRATVIADNSCGWTYKVTTPLTEGTHTISVNGSATPIIVNARVQYPLITSFFDGFPIINNQPSIEGVSEPGTQIQLWLNYISYKMLGTTVSDSNGNWSIQLVPEIYNDPITGSPITMVPLPDGANTLSTSLTVNSNEIGITGYELNRPNYSSIIGVTDNTVFNTTLSPKRMLMARYPLLSSIMRQQVNSVISFQTASKNINQVTILNGVTVSERADINQSELGNPLFLLEYATFKTRVPLNFNQILYNFMQGGIIKFDFRGTQIFALPIGSMRMSNITDEVQEWKLLLSPLTTLNSLLNVYKNGLTVTLMTNSLYHSDYNTLHFVKYDYTISAKYNDPGLYDDWFNNRNTQWTLNPMYIQKLQTNDTLRDQIITNGLGTCTLKMYKCFDGSLVDSIDYVPVNPSPIPTPDIVQEVSFDLSTYPEDQYFFVLWTGGNPICISERIETKSKWVGTILIEATNSLNKTGFFFSTGIQSIFRIEGLVKKLQPSPTTITSTDELGNSNLLYSVSARKRTIYYGNAYGLPDYLALKMAEAIQLDTLFVENQQYVLNSDEKLAPSEDINAHPMYYYAVQMLLSVNNQGNVFAAGSGANINSVVLVADAVAFGGKPGNLINIELN